MTTKADVLAAATAAVVDRGQAYGPPSANFARIARLWKGHLANRWGVHLPIDVVDVAIMHALTKVARLAETPDHLDSWIDIAGYAACGGEVSYADPVHSGNDG